MQSSHRKFQGLNDLLEHNPIAGKYFQSLPDYVQEMIRQRNDNICSEDTLRRYAENLVQGDK